MRRDNQNSIGILMILPDFIFCKHPTNIPTWNDKCRLPKVQKGHLKSSYCTMHRGKNRGHPVPNRWPISRLSTQLHHNKVVCIIACLSQCIFFYIMDTLEQWKLEMGWNNGNEGKAKSILEKKNWNQGRKGRKKAEANSWRRTRWAFIFHTAHRENQLHISHFPIELALKNYT